MTRNAVIKESLCLNYLLSLDSFSSGILVSVALFIELSLFVGYFMACISSNSVSLYCALKWAYLAILTSAVSTSIEFFNSAV